MLTSNDVTLQGTLGTATTQINHGMWYRQRKNKTKWTYTASMKTIHFVLDNVTLFETK